jgi:hypothetical protein
MPPSKSGVTRVTRVTLFAKRPDSLAFTPVTQFSSLTYIRCNAAPACNAKVSTRLLRASGLSLSLQTGFRWLLALNTGRGTPRYTVPETAAND